MVEQLYVILLPNAHGKKPDSKAIFGKGITIWPPVAIFPWLETHP